MNCKKIEQTVLSPFFVMPIFFAAVLLFFMLNFDPYTISGEVKAFVPSFVFGVAMTIVTVYLFVEYKFNRLTIRKIIAGIFILGFALRLVYCIRYNFSQNQHDVESLASSGHLSYIFGLATGEGLPDSNDWQFCHPPLHHYLASLVVRFSISLGMTNAVAFENVQYLTCFYSTLIMFVGYCILKECKVEGRALVISTALLVFHPTFYILAGSINNDVLTVLLIALSLLYLIKWYKNPTVLSALLCGLFTGLGMMTKFSASLFALIAAITVVIKFIRDKFLKIPNVIIHCCVFLAVMLPLGLWYQVRNMILFEQPLGYVAQISTTNRLYIGGMSIVERLIMPFSTDKTGVYVDVWSEYNIWQYLLRNSLFGEYSFGNEGIAVVAVLSNFLLTVLVLLSLTVLIFKRKRFNGVILPSAITFIGFWLFFVYFNITSPYRCSMDFRYIVPVLFCSAVFLGQFYMTNVDNNSALSRTFIGVLEASVILLCISSVLIFI